YRGLAYRDQALDYWSPNEAPIDPHHDDFGPEASHGPVPVNISGGDVDDGEVNGGDGGPHSTETIDVTDISASKADFGPTAKNIVCRGAPTHFDLGVLGR